jgi:hypothetical protein
MPDDVLHLIRQRIRAGDLPKQDCRMTWYGPGRGEVCVACDQPIAPDDVEVECDLPGGGGTRFHRSCCEVWSTESPTCGA